MTQTLQTDYMTNAALLGGGTGAEASYSAEDGNTYATVAYHVDIPLFVDMPWTSAMDAIGGTPIEVNGLSFIDQTSSMTAMVDGRWLVTVKGSDPATIRMLAEAIDGAALNAFDAPR